MIFSLDDLLKLLLAILAGGLIGAEREFRDKSAGFRTMILICLGSALVTMLSSRLAGDNDPTRIAANIITGIGFLGAGAILRDGLRITGLTTAATIWLTAAVGMAIGGGYWLLGSATALVAVIVLVGFPIFENWIDGLRHAHSYTIICTLEPLVYEELDRLISTSGMKVKCTWFAIGAPKSHESLVTKLIAHPAIEQMQF
jgi:putative Mg2+ transporter-C (MgtC) family protein